MENERTERPEFPCGILALVVVGLLAAAILVPNVPYFRRRPYRPSCINNLRQIDAAKEQWALENGKTNGTALTSADIVGVLSYLKNSAMPVCPRGGVYLFGKIGKNPRCTIPGHTL